MALSPPADPALARLARGAVRHRRLVLLAWLIVLVVAVIGGPKIAGEWSVDYSTPGSDAAAVEQAIAQQFPSRSSAALLVVWRGDPSATAPAVRRQLGRVLTQLAAIPGLRPGTRLADAQRSPDGRTGLLQLPLTSSPADVAARGGARLVVIAEQASSPILQVRFGGIVMQGAQRGAISSEGVGLSVALVILLLTFGSVVAAGLPIATALFGVGTGTALVGVIAGVVDTPDWAESVAAMVGIGVGIDYALLILTRHRAALGAGASVEAAVAHALTTAGRSVLVAGSTVVISLLGLLLMDLPYLQGVAFSASAGVLVVLVASLTLLPALLGFAGTRIDALAIRLPGRRLAARRAAATGRGEAHAGFRRWTAAVQRRPWTATLVGLVVIGAITAPLTTLRLGYPGFDNDPVGSQTREAQALMSGGFGAGVAGPLQVLAPAATPDATRRTQALRRTIAQDPRVAVVSAPERSTDGRSLLLTVQSRSAPTGPATDRLLQALRNETIPASGVAARVGGPAAEIHDQARAMTSHLPYFFGGVAVLSALLLLAAFRSVLIPLKAAVLNLLSILAAYGVVSLVAQGGAVGQLVGIDGQVPIPPFIPVLMFAVLFGLSMDYEVFLIGRIRELWLEHGDPTRAITDGLAMTARVITAAAAIMVAVFGAFALSDQMFLKLVGIGMATAILIDATVIRLLLVPSLMQLLGTRAWWIPRWLDRLVPSAELEGRAAPPPATGSGPAPAGNPGAATPGPGESGPPTAGA